MKKKSIDELEMLTPYELGKLLFSEVCRASPDLQFIRDLIAVGCPINSRDEYDRTALHIAARWGDLKTVKFLISKGANIHARDYDCENRSWTALHYASIHGQLGVVKFLISKGADIHARDKWGQTALHKSDCGGNPEVIKFLISKGAQLDVRDHWGQTAWDLATKKSREAIPELEPK